jgi:hypothetical protein
MTHITRLQAENFKRLSVIDVQPGTAAGIVPIRGRNAQGKSSTLDAIMAALGGKNVMPTAPVRKGEEEGAIQLQLDDGTVILRRFTVDGKGDTLSVTNGQGFKATSPQQLLDKLYSSVAFDPLAFTRLDAEKQFGVLRSLVKIDVDLDALAKADKADYDDRRDINRDIKTLEAQLPALQPQGTVPEEPVDVAALQTKLEEAAEHNGNIERRKANREAFIAEFEKDHQALAKIKLQIRELQDAAEVIATTIAAKELQMSEAPALPDPIDVSAVSEQLRAATTANEQHRKQMVYLAEKKTLELKREASETLTKRLEEREKERAAAIERADMPVPGLSFGDGEVLFNGVPLAQASSAEQLRISTAIGIASSPQLRVMLVRDGSLLDDEGQKILADMAADNNFQLWVEAVDTSGKVGIVLEAGEVVTIDGEEAPAPEPIKAARRRKKDQDAEDSGAPVTGGQSILDQGEGEKAVQDPSPAPQAEASPAAGEGQEGAAIDPAAPSELDPDRMREDRDERAADEADYRYDDRRDSLFD